MEDNNNIEGQTNIDILLSGLSFSKEKDEIVEAEVVEKKGKRIELTETQIAEFKADWLLLTYDKLVEKYKISTKTITRRAKSFGCQLPKPPIVKLALGIIVPKADEVKSDEVVNESIARIKFLREEFDKVSIDDNLLEKQKRVKMLELAHAIVAACASSQRELGLADSMAEYIKLQAVERKSKGDNKQDEIDAETLLRIQRNAVKDTFVSIYKHLDGLALNMFDYGVALATKRALAERREAVSQDQQRIHDLTGEDAGGIDPEENDKK
jgi:hypothetical protein